MKLIIFITIADFNWKLSLKSAVNQDLIKMKENLTNSTWENTWDFTEIPLLLSRFIILPWYKRWIEKTKWTNLWLENLDGY